MARRHIPYVVTFTGKHWEAHHAVTGKLVARDYRGEVELRSVCDSMTEDAR